MDDNSDSDNDITSNRLSGHASTHSWYATSTSMSSSDPWTRSAFAAFETTSAFSGNRDSMASAASSVHDGIRGHSGLGATLSTDAIGRALGSSESPQDDPWADAAIAAAAVLTSPSDPTVNSQRANSIHATATGYANRNANRRSLPSVSKSLSISSTDVRALSLIQPSTPTLTEFMDILHKYESGQDIDFSAMANPRHAELVGFNETTDNDESGDITDSMDSSRRDTGAIYQQGGGTHNSRMSDSAGPSSLSDGNLSPTGLTHTHGHDSLLARGDLHTDTSLRKPYIASTSPVPPQSSLQPSVQQQQQQQQQRRTDKDQTSTATKSQTISNIQSVFTDTQKIAYVGLCYLCISQFRKVRLEKLKRAAAAYDVWSAQFMEKLYVYLDLLPEERMMIKNLAEHGLLPSDLSTGLLNDAKQALAQLEEQQHRAQRAEQDALDSFVQPDLVDESSHPVHANVADGHLSPTAVLSATKDNTPSDIRYTILSHLFILSIADGQYDARARCILRTIARDMEIPMLDLVKLESVIAEQLRIYEDHDAVKPDEEVVDQRNKVDGRNRWLLAGIATLAGGAVIGVTAGLAAPFIGAGIGAALTTFGITGATGVTTFMAGTGGLAIITTGGVLTGGGMSGAKMMRRTRGIEEFEFLGLEDAIRMINENKEKRRAERRKRRRCEARQKQEEEAHEGGASQARKASHAAGLPAAPARPGNHPIKGDTKLTDATQSDVLWEMTSVADTDADEVPGDYANDPVSAIGKDGEGHEHGDTASNDLHGSPDGSSKSATKAKPTNVLITVAGWVSNGKDDHTVPFSVLEPGQNGDQYSLIWETKALQELGSALRILVSEVASFIVQQGLQATLLPVLMAGLTGPLWMIKLTYLVDNPWGNALTKAEKAGRVLADTLMGQVQGHRPITLVGFSLGARAIYFCLLELAAHGAHGIIEDAYMFGTPVIGSRKSWERISSVVAGRVVNGYTQNDMLLGVLYRASLALWSDVAGLRPVLDVPGIENMDLSDIVKGHLDYRSHLPVILKECGFAVSADEFEDQDDEEEEERLEIEKERIEAKEQRNREREERQQKRLDEALRRTRERQAELERKRKEKEDATLAAAIASARKKADAAVSSSSPATSSGWFGSRRTPSVSTSYSSSSPTPTGSSSISHLAPTTQDRLVADELRQMSELEDMMQVYWEPREIKSTLPPLVIVPSVPVAAASAGGSTLEPGIDRTNEHDDRVVDEHAAVTSPSVDAQSTTSDDIRQMDILQHQMNELGRI
ncbi:hypothetical protein BASA50_011066 [Batrachochytrium salamandrivorans]|uniref:DUF726-domain-containing protein n=1 Tax=Batrachochytrium salamandrivorans TaxID=1357716 RepID=A0ABQ8EWP7_9FUNG|nr:hypothetical protein BASA50_011066 [Batrachochytrium salamandrivorans]KAH9265322.1 hypothetical protein BASA83_011133 [Batrachochytrium salamandrivorans]